MCTDIDIREEGGTTACMIMKIWIQKVNLGCVPDGRNSAIIDG